MGRIVTLGNPVNDSLLARIRVDEVSMDDARRLATRLYETELHKALRDHAPTTVAQVTTSMVKYNPEDAVWTGEVIDKSVPIVISAIARGGLLPAHVCLDELSMYGYRQAPMDCLLMNRTTGEDGHVNGVEVQGRKMGKSVESAMVLYPDCMVATGDSLVEARRIYQQYGTARKHIVMALICTPEGIKHLMQEFPDTILYTIAIDAKLNERDYILPGAGDMGNKLNGPSDFYIMTGRGQ